MEKRVWLIGLSIGMFLFSGFVEVLANSNGNTAYFGTELTMKYSFLNFPKGSVEKSSIKEIKTDFPNNSHIIISLDLLPAFIIPKREIMTGNFSLEYYLVGEEIEGIAYSIETFPKNFNISKIELTLIFPNDTIKSFFLDVEKETRLHIFKEPLELKDNGLLKIEININTSQNCIIWRNLTYKGIKEYLTYHPIGNTTGESETYFNIYRQAIPVLTSYEAMMIGERILTERGVKATEKNIFWQSVAAVSAIVSTIITIIINRIFLWRNKKRNFP